MHDCSGARISAWFREKEEEIQPNNPYFPSARDSLSYHTSVKTIIHATGAAGAR
jgi:hypothetical protein